MTCFKKAITETYAELQVRKITLHYSKRLLQIFKSLLHRLSVFSELISCFRPSAVISH